jgi:hypothetical protein
MPVVINEFEVVPESPKNDNQAAANKQGEKSGGSAVQPPTDYEIKQLLERRAERLERVSTY